MESAFFELQRDSPAEWYKMHPFLVLACESVGAQRESFP